METPRHGHAPIAMHFVPDASKIIGAGDFFIEGDHIHLGIPSPVSVGFTIVRLPVKKGPNKPGVYWGWDGNEDKPTLTPSIHTHGHWHGWVRNGMMVEA